MNVALEESVGTVGDPLSHVLGGSVTFDGILIPFYPVFVCLSRQWIRPDKCANIEGLTGSHRLTEIYGRFLFSSIFSQPQEELRGESALNLRAEEGND